MKRERQRRVRGNDDGERFARAALAELRAVWKAERRTNQQRRTVQAARLVRLAAETREMLALWTYYRLACLDALERGPMGAA
jgi:hypothetical protein